ncbi:transcriptional regulator ATRX homolog [Euwallacea similis]|uniref:transcriptional regulator ATRX homolog n=1 Tax=Euwallacea similis TaxID=1736056 RepID=UPI00344BC991
MNREKMWRKPRERLRYTNEHSLMLLKEVLDRNPFEDPYRWSTVHENFVRMTARPHTLRSVREHVDYLLKLYVKGDLENKARYKGSDDEHTEKLQLLQEVLALKEKYFDVIQEKKPVRELRSKRPRSETSSNEDNDESTDMFLDEELNDLPQAAGSISSATQDGGLANIATLQFFKDKHTTEVEVRRAEIDLQEKKLLLAEREFKLQKEKFELEKQERQRRLDLELQERSMHMKVLEQQQKLIRMFFEQHK